MRGRQFLNDWQAKLWSRFFCLSVYVTMYLNDHQRSAFYESIGLNTTQFNRCAFVRSISWPCAFHKELCVLRQAFCPSGDKGTGLVLVKLRTRTLPARSSGSCFVAGIRVAMDKH